MKKTIVLAIAAALAALALAGCGGGAQASSSAEPPDLTGTWKQVNSATANSYQRAEIEGAAITIYWVNDATDTESLYWAGTYDAPAEAVDTWSWTSENDTAKTSTAMLASSDATKEFTYEKGQITYKASAMGSTQTVRLERAE